MRFLNPILPLLLLPALAVTAQVPAPKPSHNPTPRPAPTSPATAAPPAPVDSLTGPASTEYRRGALGRFFLGKHHRPTWEMPVTVPAFYPDRLFGGLTPIKTGGSMQTLNLRMVSKDGHQYVLRSVDKDIKRALGEGSHNGPGARVLQDQMAAIYPYGALMAASLAETVGVYHATPQLYRVPTDRNVLGNFQKDFAGKLVYLEERPDGNWTDHTAFGNSAQVGSSAAMLRARYAAPGTPMNGPLVDVEARAYLRARLLDIYLGDWSRREDQWRWALRTEENGTPRYRAVPRDRDQAFSRYSDGLFPAIAVLFRPKIVSFGPKIGRVKRYTYASETLDRVLLGWLSEVDFKAEAEALQKALSDEAIDRSLTRMPTNVQRLDGRKLRQDLQARRQQLPAAAAELYRYLAEEVVLPGTDGPDTYQLSPGADGGINITWIGRLDTAGRQGASTYGRTFKPKETKRIRIYALGGNDRLELATPLPKDGPQVEFFDGPGNDVATRKDGVETPQWLHLRASSDKNTFDEFPEWCRKPDADTRARDYDASGFLLRHRLD